MTSLIGKEALAPRRIVVVGARCWAWRRRRLIPFDEAAAAGADVAVDAAPPGWLFVCLRGATRAPRAAICP